MVREVKKSLKEVGVYSYTYSLTGVRQNSGYERVAKAEEELYEKMGDVPVATIGKRDENSAYIYTNEHVDVAEMVAKLREDFYIIWSECETEAPLLFANKEAYKQRIEEIQQGNKTIADFILKDFKGTKYGEIIKGELDKVLCKDPNEARDELDKIEKHYHKMLYNEELNNLIEQSSLDKTTVEKLFVDCDAFGSNRWRNCEKSLKKAEKVYENAGEDKFFITVDKEEAMAYLEKLYQEFLKLVPPNLHLFMNRNKFRSVTVDQTPLPNWQSVYVVCNYETLCRTLKIN